MVKKQSVGAHYGWQDWLIQRVTALVMAVFSVFIFGWFMVKGGATWVEWRELFSSQFVRVGAMLFLLSVYWHAWIGIRDILMDYIKPLALRLGLEVLFVLVLATFSIWSAAILWGR